jgi:pimeloyl-ACP methyl ester carboxylesterase
MPSIDVNGVNTVYQEYGDPKSIKHILFIHGLGDSSLSWRDIPEALSNFFHTITIDLVGFGASDKPEKPEYYTIKGLSKFVVDFLEKIGLNKEEQKESSNTNNNGNHGSKHTVYLVGISLGGYIAAQVAIENSDMIKKLVLAGSAGLLEKPTQVLQEYFNAAMEVNPISRYEKVKRALENMYASPSSLLSVSISFFNNIIEKPGARYAFKEAFNTVTTTQISSKEFKRIEDVPCLILWGDKDIAIPKMYLEKFRQCLPNAMSEEITNAGHSLVDEKTAVVYEKMRRFLVS